MVQHKKHAKFNKTYALFMKFMPCEELIVFSQITKQQTEQREQADEPTQRRYGNWPVLPAKKS